MAFLDRRETWLATDWRRILLGIVAAPVVPALLFGPSSLGMIWQVAALGFASVIFLFLPLLAWRLPRTRHPLLTCIVAGAVAAPGPFGYAFVLIGLAYHSGWLALGTLLFAAPLGAIGGFVFWLCAVWDGAARSESG